MARGLICALAAVALHASLSLGCRDAQQSAVPEETNLEESGPFGDYYEIVTNESAALPEDSPALSAETLAVRVAYTGGCEDHNFDFAYDSDDDTTIVWITHQNADDACKERVLDRLEFVLPEEALGRRTIILLNPEHEVPFVLRWGVPSPFDTIGFSQSAR